MARPTQISHALLFWDGLALPKYLGMSGGRRTVMGVVGVIWVFRWSLVWFGDVWCGLGVLVGIGDVWRALGVLVMFCVVRVLWWVLVRFQTFPC